MLACRCDKFCDQDRDVKLCRTSFPITCCSKMSRVFFTSARPLLHQHVCQGWLTGSQELGEADGFNLDSTAASVGHAADQL